MWPAREKRIVFLGPPGAGVTSLLAAMKPSLIAGAHGFSPSAKFLIEYAPESGEDAGSPFELPQPPHFPEGGHNLTDYTFVLSRRQWIRFPTGRHRPTLHRVQVTSTDVPGTIFSDGETQPALIERLKMADGLVLVWPLGRTPAAHLPDALSAAWLPCFANLAATEKREICPRLETVAIVFSCYDRELLLAGRKAAEAALDPAELRLTLVRALDRNDLLRTAIGCMERWSPQIELMAASSFGLIRDYWEANWIPGADASATEPGGPGLLTLVRQGAFTGGAHVAPLPLNLLGDRWVPLFAADAVIRIVFGLRHALMIRWQEISSGWPS